jgi:cytochrome o ubiquinol oxidase operon protein cyoD
MLSTIFTVVFVAIAIAGTLWVMFNMNTHMMPKHPTPTPPPLSSVAPTPHAG